MICVQLGNKFDWLGLVYGLVYLTLVLPCGRIGQEKQETDEEYDEDCVKEGFQLARVKFDRDGERGREALGMRNCSINLLNELELELA